MRNFERLVDYYIALFKALWRFFRPQMRYRISVFSDDCTVLGKLSELNKKEGIEVCPRLFKIDRFAFCPTRDVEYRFVLIPASEWLEQSSQEHFNTDQIFERAKIAGLVIPNLEASVLLCEKLASDLSYPKNVTIFHPLIDVIKNTSGAVIQVERDRGVTRIMPLVSGSWGDGEYFAFLLPSFPTAPSATKAGSMKESAVQMFGVKPVFTP
jgi:hypothetical protein